VNKTVSSVRNKEEEEEEKEEEEVFIGRKRERLSK